MKLHLVLESPEEKVTPIKMTDAIIELVNSTMNLDRYPNALQEIAGHLDIYNTYDRMNQNYSNSIGVCEH